MLTWKPSNFFTLFLIFVVCLSLVNVDIAYADDSAPTEAPVATEPTAEPPLVTDVATEQPTATEVPIETSTEDPVEPTIESTSLPAEATPTPEGELQPTDITEPAPSEEPIATEKTPEAPILSLVPEDTSIVVLDEQGEPLALATQDAAEALVASDPVWCPASVSAPTPGSNNCSISYPSITALIDAMRIDPASFDENGTIFLEKPGGQGFTTPLILDDSAGSLAGSFSTLSAFNLTIQGGWNGNSPGTFSFHTNFGAQAGNEGYVLIGSATNPWAGDITLRRLHLSGISVANSVTIYTSSGDIVLSDVEVFQQTGTQYTAYLESTSGNITVGDTSFFDGNDSGGNRNRGFYAETGIGSISITGTGTSPTFQDARGTDPANYNGATLSAPVVTLTNVIAQDNDGNGIEILNANVVTLNNVTSGLVPNGAGSPYSEGNGLSGVLINGTGTTSVTINGGSFNRNERYGIEILNSSAISIPTTPTYDGNVLGNFYENGMPDTSITSNLASPTNSTSAGFSFTGTDNFTSAASLTFQCSLDGAAFATCTSPIVYAGLAEGPHNFQVRAGDQSGNLDLSPASFSWIIDLTPPIISPHVDETAEATSAAGAVVNYTSPTTSDAVDGSGVASCLPASGTFFAFGDTVVNCNATDDAGNVAVPTSFTVHVVDTTGPVIAAHADESAEATSASGAIVIYVSPTTSDAVDGAGIATCAPASGSTFPLGDTTVNCTAYDNAGNPAAATSFVVHVVDTTAPTIASHPDITVGTSDPAGIVVNYSSPATSDLVDGAGTASCLPASGSLFPLGNTQVTCTATDSHGNNSTPATFVVHVVKPIVHSTPGSTHVTSEFVIPITGGGLVDLDCNSIFWIRGIRIGFLNLCDYQATMNVTDAAGLPANLPDGYSFVSGLAVDVLQNGQLVKDLPVSSGVQMDFPIPNGSKSQFAVLYWSDDDGDGKGEWLEISQQITQDKLSATLLVNAEDELYQVVQDPKQATNVFHSALTTDKTGLFVLVTK